MSTVVLVSRPGLFVVLRFTAGTAYASRRPLPITPAYLPTIESPPRTVDSAPSGIAGSSAERGPAIATKVEAQSQTGLGCRGLSNDAAKPKVQGYTAGKKRGRDADTTTQHHGGGSAPTYP